MSETLVRAINVLSPISTSVEKFSYLLVYSFYLGPNYLALSIRSSALFWSPKFIAITTIKKLEVKTVYIFYSNSHATMCLCDILISFES